MARKIQAPPPEIEFRLAETMHERGFNKNKLCVATGLRFETVQSYISGNRKQIDLHTLVALCKALQCEIDDIIRYKG